MVEDKENIDIRRPEEKSNQEIFRRYVQMEICVSNFEKACDLLSIRLFRKQSAKNDEEYWSEQEGQGLFLQHDDVFVQLCHFGHLCGGTNVYELYQEEKNDARLRNSPPQSDWTCFILVLNCLSAIRTNDLKIR